MRCSLRHITSGALRSISFFNRLLRLITLRYRSLRSDVANRPPVSCTIGRKSGGITGNACRHIALGLIPARNMLSSSLRRFINFFLRCPFAPSTSSVSSAIKSVSSISSSNSFKALPPMPTSISSSNSSGRSW